MHRRRPHTLWSGLLTALLSAATSCSDDASADPDTGPDDDAHVDIDSDDVGPAGPCSIEALREPVVATNYFVAAEVPGADDDNCDGLAPTDEGGGRCPFRSLAAVTRRGLLIDKFGVRVSLRTGRYIIAGWQGMAVNGAGSNLGEATILSNYEGEEAVLDVPSPDGVNCDVSNFETDPDCVRQLLVMSGRFSIVQGLTIQNGLAHHVEIRGGSDQLLRCNQIAETVSFGMRSDLVKLSGGATRVNIRHNRLSRFWSQAIDITGVHKVVIEDNEIFDSADPAGGATGSKYGSRNITIRNNTIHGVCPGGDGVVFSLGGTGSAHPDDAAAYTIVVEGNTVYDSPCKVAQFVSCQDCRFDNNDITNVGAGVLLSGAATGLPECSTSTTGCQATHGVSFQGNRLRRLHGGGDPDVADSFFHGEAGEGVALVASNNVYCTSVGGAAKFAYEGHPLDFAAWQAATGTDQGSRVLPQTAAPCE